MDSQAQATTRATPPTGNVGINLLAWVEVNKKRLAYAGVGIVALILVAAIYIQQQSGRETAASHALSDVRMPFNPSLPPEPGTAEKLFKIANEYKGTKAAAQALLRSAGLLYTENDFAKAQERFNSLIQQYPESPWVADAHLGVAACLLAQGKTDDAIKKYEDLRKRYANAPIADDVKLALGRLYEKSNAAEAYRLYDELLRGAQGNPNSPTILEAAFHQENLVKANPELAKLREPAVPPTPPIQITPVTNPPGTGASRTISLTNLIPRTNTAGTNPPIQIKVNPVPAPTTPAPGSTQPAPAPAPAPTPGK